MAQNGKYLGRYNAKVEVVGGSGHSFQCWKTPRKSYFNGSKSLQQTNETAFTFLYSNLRNPFPTDISLDTKTFLTKLRNYYTPRGNTFYNLEVGKDTSDFIQVQINYYTNTITVKEGLNFKINLISGLFKKGDIVTVVQGGKTIQYQLQKDKNYAKANMKLYCDPYYGFDSYVIIHSFKNEVNTGYVPPAPKALNASQPKVPQTTQNIPQYGQKQYNNNINQGQQRIPPKQQYYGNMGNLAPQNPGYGQFGQQNYPPYNNNFYPGMQPNYQQPQFNQYNNMQRAPYGYNPMGYY